MARCFVMREMEIDTQDLRLGDIYRMTESTDYDDKQWWYTFQTPYVDANKLLHIPSQPLILTYCAAEYNLMIRRFGIQTREEPSDG